MSMVSEILMRLILRIGGYVYGRWISDYWKKVPKRLE